MRLFSFKTVVVDCPVTDKEYMSSVTNEDNILFTGFDQIIVDGKSRSAYEG